MAIIDDRAITKALEGQGKPDAARVREILARARETKGIPAPDALAAGAGQDLAGAALVGLSLDEVERRAVEATFRAADGNKTRAAKLLGVTPKTFSRKLVKHKIPH